MRNYSIIHRNFRQRKNVKWLELSLALQYDKENNRYGAGDYFYIPRDAIMERI